MVTTKVIMVNEKKTLRILRGFRVARSCIIIVTPTSLRNSEYERIYKLAPVEMFPERISTGAELHPNRLLTRYSLLFLRK